MLLDTRCCEICVRMCRRIVLTSLNAGSLTSLGAVGAGVGAHMRCAWRRAKTTSCAHNSSNTPTAIAAAAVATATARRDAVLWATRIAVAPCSNPLMQQIHAKQGAVGQRRKLGNGRNLALSDSASASSDFA